MAKVDEERIRRIDELVRRIEQISDRDTRETAHQLMESILELHGAGLDRMMEIVSDSGDAGQAIIQHLANDALVSSLLLLHGLHPDDLETRVYRAIARLNGDISNGHAELVGAYEGVVRIRVMGGGCGFRQSVEQTIREAAPDATEVVIEERAQPNGFVPLAALGMAVTGTG
jgi:hypothetical protein